jgi:hypothetical protein
MDGTSDFKQNERVRDVARYLDSLESMLSSHDDLKREFRNTAVDTTLLLLFSLKCKYCFP